jgi:hypothetical protein
MPVWLIGLLDYLGPKVVNWLKELYKQIQKVKKLERKADENIKKAEEYEKDPSNANANELP